MIYPTTVHRSWCHLSKRGTLHRKRSNFPIIYPLGSQGYYVRPRSFQGNIYPKRSRHRNFNRKIIKMFHDINVTNKDTIAGNFPEEETSPEISTTYLKRIQKGQLKFCLSCAINVRKNRILKAHLSHTLQASEFQIMKKNDERSSFWEIFIQLRIYGLT